MKSLSKIIAKIFLTIIIFCNLFFVFGVDFSYAAEKNLNEKCLPGSDTCKQGQCLQTGYSTYQCVKFSAQVPIPDVPFVQPQNSTAALGNYIKGLYNYFIGITAIVATVVLMIGGFQWVVAGGNSSKIEEAKSWIMGALSGLALALSSYMILSLISPNLVNFKVRNIKPIKPMASTPVSDCDEWGTYCTIGTKKGYCNKEEVCTDCLGAGFTCDNDFECCSNICYYKDGLKICEEDESVDDCASEPDGTECNHIKFGKGYCEGSVCQPCKGTGFACSGVFKNYECCNGDCEGSSAGTLCN